VHPNTFDSLKYIKAQYKEEHPDDWYPYFCDHIEGDKDLEKANQFELFGWGKFASLKDPRSGLVIEEYGDTFDIDFGLELFDTATYKELSNHLSSEQVYLLSSGFRWC
tara:strand:+ start:343 stop:666 length:324 start_codon:yes stop_codon:yes gene_type:complete